MREIKAHWKGPFAWPRLSNGLPPSPKAPGLYLQTFEYQDGFIVYGAGLTRRTVARRLAEHTLNYMNGMYSILDVNAVNTGNRREIWHGFFWKHPRSDEKEAAFEARKSEIQAAAQRQLNAFRIFVTDIGTQPRLLERLEAATMGQLYKSQPPFRNLPDRGVMLAPRRDAEEAILFTGTCEHRLFALPLAFEI